jgi:hypothetical protein
MLVAKYTTLELQFELLDSLAAVVDDMYVGEEVRPTNPYLSMESSCDTYRLAMPQEARLGDCQWTR